MALLSFEVNFCITVFYFLTFKKTNKQTKNEIVYYSFEILHNISECLFHQINNENLLSIV